MMTATEAANKVLDKLMTSTVQGAMFGVFVKDKTSIQMTKPNTEVFAKAIEVRRKDFAGVYDINVPLEWVIEDLRYCGMK